MANHLYLIICGRSEPYVAERDLKDMGREETIKQLAAGEWGSIDGDRFMVSSIIEVDSGADRTDEFIEAARMLMDSNRTFDSYRTPFTGQDAIDWQNDRRRAEETAS